MQSRTSPVYQVFERHHREAKALFLAMGKQAKPKKAVELLGKLRFMEIYSEFLAKAHPTGEGSESLPGLFSPLLPLIKPLQKIQHLKLVEKRLKNRELETKLSYESFKLQLSSEKRKVQKEAFELMVGSTLKPWEDLVQGVFLASKNLSPLAINTAINQLAHDELTQLRISTKPPIAAEVFRELFESLKKIIMLENLLIHWGFNPIFVRRIHNDIHRAKENLKPWYTNHLTYQAMVFFLSEKENIPKKYLDWLKDLKEEKKSLSSEIEKQTLDFLKKVAL